MYQILSTF